MLSSLSVAAVVSERPVTSKFDHLDIFRGGQSHVEFARVITDSTCLLITCTWAESEHLMILSSLFCNHSSEAVSATSGWLRASVLSIAGAVLSGETRFAANTMSSVG